MFDPRRAGERLSRARVSSRFSFSFLFPLGVRPWQSADARDDRTIWIIRKSDKSARDCDSKTFLGSVEATGRFSTIGGEEIWDDRSTTQLLLPSLFEH